MKKLLLIILFFAVSNTVYANGKILKSGFITKSASVKEGMNIEDPKNKIIIIYNHGQNSNDKAHKNECMIKKLWFIIYVQMILQVICH